jgi:hypothetical protein
MEDTLKRSQITAIDFFDDLTSSYARKWFVGGFVILIVACILAVWGVNEYVSWPTANKILDSLFVEVAAGSLLILAFYALYIYFIGPNAEARAVSVIRPQDIGERVKALPLGTRHYMFWGRSGSFFRAHQLLKLDEEAREKRRNIVVDVLVPDPNDDRLVASYRSILTSLGEKNGENPLLANVLATCMACAIVAANNKYLEIRVSLSSFLPAFRVDLSDNGAILTQDDPKKSALYFEFDSEFYDMFRSTVANERDLSKKVAWNADLFRGRTLEEKSCDKQTLEAFGIKVEKIDSLQQEVAMLITKRPHRYK